MDSQFNSDYWEQVARLWDLAEQSVVTHRVPKATVRRSSLRSFLTRILGSDMPIIITGERGAGKTELYRALTGALPTRSEGVSEDREELRAAMDTGKGKIRSTFVTVPGQDSDPTGQVLEDLFAGERAPRGVIHVVTAGHDHIWGESERLLVEAELLREQAERQAEIEELEALRERVETAEKEAEAARLEAEAAARAAGGGTLPPDVTVKMAHAQAAARAAGEAAARFTAAETRRLEVLRQLQVKPLAWHLSEAQKAEELKRFRRLCRDHLRTSWSRLPEGRRPIWMIIAVAKCDLWYERRKSVKDYYVPRGMPSDSPFARELRDFAAEVGASRLNRLAVLPVASYPQPLRLTAALGEHRPALVRRETDSLLNHFRNVVGEFCAS